MPYSFIQHATAFIATALLCLSTASYGELYSWIAEDGSRVYSDQKPSAAKPGLVVNESKQPINYYSGKKPSLPILEVVEESNELLAIEPVEASDKKQWDEDECQEIYALSCDAVYNWREHAIEACGDDERCEDENFLIRKYKPLTLEEKRKRTLRNSARQNREDREIRDFLMRKYTPYCAQQAAQYCNYKRQGSQCLTQMEASCKDKRSLGQLLTQYNLTAQEKQAIIEKAKHLVALEREKDINEAINTIIELIKLQAMLL